MSNTYSLVKLTLFKVALDICAVEIELIHVIKGYLPFQTLWSTYEVECTSEHLIEFLVDKVLMLISMKEFVFPSLKLENLTVVKIMKLSTNRLSTVLIQKVLSSMLNNF